MSSRAGEPARRGGAAAWIAAGALGGALAGAVDASWSVVRGIGGVSGGQGGPPDRRRRGPAGAGRPGAGPGGRAGQRGGRGARAIRAARGALAGGGAGARRCWWLDAFAMFSGHLAASLPGTPGRLGAAGRASGWRPFLDGAPDRPRPGRRIGRALARRRAGRRGAWAPSWRTAWCCRGCTSGSTTRWRRSRLVAAVVAGRLGMRRRGPVGAAILGAGGAGGGARRRGAALRGSQVLRYAASERTALASVALRGAPGLLRGPAAGAAARGARRARCRRSPRGRGAPRRTFW